MKILSVIVLMMFCSFANATGDTTRIKIKKDDPVLAAMDSLEALGYLNHEKFTVTRNKAKYPLPADSVPRPDVNTYIARLKKLDAKSPMNLA